MEPATTFRLPAASTSLAASEAAAGFTQPAKAATTLPSVGPPTTAQITALIDEMRHQDMALRLNAFKNLPQLAQAMGAERTRNDLMPYVEGQSKQAPQNDQWSCDTDLHVRRLSHCFRF
jgi:hypothetical protein